MSHSHQLTENSILGGRYRIVKVLGEGGFGITYEGYDTLFNVKVAIKEYYPIGLVNRTVTETTEVTAFTRENEVIFERGKSSFLKEAKTLARFASNPNIVSVKDFFELNNTVYMVMELLEGTDVKGFLKYNGKMSFEDTFTLLRPVMEALSQVHAAGLIHRDISPDNIMITQDGTTKLLDFGAAREMSADGEKSLSILLKPGFAPQEQYTKKGQQGPWTDVYALCATMYKMMTLQTPDDAMSRVFDDELENIRKYNPSVSEEECAVILKGMSVKIEDRYQSIGELIKGCEDILEKKYVSNGQDDFIEDSKNIPIDKNDDEYEMYDKSVDSYDFDSDSESNKIPLVNNKLFIILFGIMIILCLCGIVYSLPFEPTVRFIFAIVTVIGVVYIIIKGFINSGVHEYFTDSTSKSVYMIKKKGSENIQGEVIYLHPQDKNAKIIKISEMVSFKGINYGVIEINEEAFKGCNNLNEVTISKSVRSIGDEAFYNCKALKKITIKGTKIKKFGKNSFKGIFPVATFRCPQSMVKKYQGQIKKAKAPLTSKFYEISI